MRAFCKEKIKQIWNTRRPLLLVCALTAIFAVLYAGFLVNKTMPPAEGWYTYYAYLINEEGAIPYVDFELLFPPLYTYMIALFTKVFGYGILALRIFGVVIYALTGVFACLIFEKLTNKPWMGLLGGVIAIAVLQSEAVQIFYDYIRIMDLFVYASVYFFLRYLDRIRLDQNRTEGVLKPRFNVNVILGAVFAVLASMCKQSSGLIFLMFCLAFFIFLLICLPHRKELLLQLGTVLGVTVVLYGVMVLFLALQGSLSAYVHYNFVSSVDAKGGGSLLNVLFGWIPRSKGALLRGLRFTLIPIALLGGSIFLGIKFPAKQEEMHPRFVRVARIVLPILLLLSVVLPFWFGWFASFISKFTGSVVMWVAFLFSTLFFVLASFAVIFRKKIRWIKDWRRHYKYVFLSGVIFVLGFSVCTSGGLAESQTALAFGFVPILLMLVSFYRKREIAIGILCVAMVFEISVCFGRKANSTYGWWGLNTGSYAEQTETCDVPIFKGIHMDAAYAKMYNDVYEGVTQNTDPDDEIFVFPHMPILYTATDRPKATQTAVQWFDVSTDAAVMADIETIREKKPKVIVICSVGDYVIQNHESSFRNGEISGLHAMQDFLNEFVVDEGYACLSENPLSGDYVVTVWCLTK
ncbi:MAG: glycosyltransferase family 39 protein [Clostridia bacterium]|nr:glycosyltransferase family 39 protein [Clostridia bacterium]